MTRAYGILASIAMMGAVGSTVVDARAGGSPDDALQAVLEQSKADKKGLTFYVNGQAIPGVVVAIGNKYLLARNREQGTVVIQLDRLDAIAGFVDLPGQ